MEYDEMLGGWHWIMEVWVWVIRLGWTERLMEQEDSVFEFPLAISLSFYVLVFGISFD